MVDRGLYRPWTPWGHHWHSDLQRLQLHLGHLSRGLLLAAVLLPCWRVTAFWRLLLAPTAHCSMRHTKAGGSCVGPCPEGPQEGFIASAEIVDAGLVIIRGLHTACRVLRCCRIMPAAGAGEVLKGGVVSGFVSDLPAGQGDSSGCHCSVWMRRGFGLLPCAGTTWPEAMRL